MSILDMTALELGKRIQSGDITAIQVAEASLTCIKAVEPSIHAYVTVNEEKIVEQAGEVQAEIEAGRPSGLLAGVPVATKDNVCTEGMRTICSSRILENFIPAYTAQAVASLEQAGAVILGKINTDEFVMGSITETSVFGVIRNSWNPEYASGGSSGGSCAAVAAGECLYVLGSDTGGFIRQSNPFCGVIGIKPTYRIVSRYGSTAYGSSLDQIGSVAKDVSDCAAVLEVLTSHDFEDSTSMERSDYDFTAVLSEDVRGMHIGIPESCLGQGLDQEVKGAVLEVARVLGEKGATVETLDLKLVEYAMLTYYAIASAEASSNLSRFDGIKYGYRVLEYEGLHSVCKKSRSQGFGPEVKRRAMLGSFVLSSGYYDAYCLKALRTKALIKKEFDRTLASYDVILVPAAPAIVPRSGQPSGDPPKTYLGDTYTTPVNLVGLPGIGFPYGLDPKGLPIGLQLIGDYSKEKSTMRTAYAYEKARKWKLLPVATGTPEGLFGVTAGEVERRTSHEQTV